MNLIDAITKKGSPKKGDKIKYDQESIDKFDLEGNGEEVKFRKLKKMLEEKKKEKKDD